MVKVVIDVDGVLLDVHSLLESRLNWRGYTGFSMGRVLTYDFNKSLNPVLVPDWLKSTSDGNKYFLNVPREEIFRELSNDRLFLRADFFEEALEYVKTLCKISGVEVVISTQSYSDDIALIKRERISSKLKGFDYTYKDFIGNTKGTIDDADYIVEDCIDNLSAYGSGCRKFLVSKPYNKKEFNMHKSDFKDISVRDSAAEALFEISCDVCF